MSNDKPLDHAGELYDFIQELNAEDDAATKEATRNLKVYEVERSNEKEAKDHKDAAGSVIKGWFLTHPDETELVDGEWQLVARMQTRRLPGHKYDLTAIIENNPGLLQRLISVRALVIDHDVAVAQGLEGEIKRYKMPSGETQALIVKAVE